MKTGLFISTARRLMRQPAAPFHEELVQREVLAICAEHRLGVERDRFGNLLVSHKRGRTPRPLVLVAHMDHPGFDVVRERAPTRWESRFLGGVPPEYFRKGTPVRLMPGNHRAALGRPLKGQKEFELVAQRRPRASPQFAVWDLPAFRLDKTRLHGRACDDLVGVAAILATLIELKQRRKTCHVIGVITRAEEIGFGGALCLAAERSLPPKSLVVSLETSRELPPVKMGSGVIVRVGDRSSVFDSRATRFLTEAAGDLSGADPGFGFQRALMSGGSCEGTVFADAGYCTAALCVALGNYHNCGPHRRIAAEFVSRSDAESMVRLLVHCAERMRQFDELTGRLTMRLTALRKGARVRLVKTA